MVNIGTTSTFDPADADEDELRSLIQLKVKYVYHRLIEKGDASATAEISEHAGTYRMVETTAKILPEAPRGRGERTAPAPVAVRDAPRSAPLVQHRPAMKGRMLQKVVESHQTSSRSSRATARERRSSAPGGFSGTRSSTPGVTFW